MQQDILILGGGPGGLSTALHIARDFPHLLSRLLVLEKAIYPRPKLCAGGLVVDAEILLQRLGLDAADVAHADAGCMHFDYDGRGLDIRTRKGHVLRVIRRDRFDHWLAENAIRRGVEVRQGVTVRSVLPDSDGVTVKTDRETFRAKIVVGADGSNGVTRRSAGFASAPVHTARVLEVLTPLQPPARREVRPLTEDGEEGFDQAYFEFAPVTQNIAGYVWDFPTRVDGRAMRCRGIYDTNLLAAEKRPPLRDPLGAHMARAGFDPGAYEIKGHPIRYFSPHSPMARPGILLVGDAAGADPFLGEGISIAMGYGLLAAHEIGAAFANNDYSFSRYRQRVLTSALGQALITRWLLAQGIYALHWRWLQVLIWRYLRPLAVPFAWNCVLNWGRRLSSTP